MCFWLAENKCYFCSTRVQHHGANAKLKHIVVQILVSLDPLGCFFVVNYDLVVIAWFLKDM